MDDTFDKLRKKYDKGGIIDLQDGKSLDIKRYPTGSLLLDIHTGGGWPKGRIIEIYGPESSGKSTTAIHAIAEVQKLGGAVGYIDMEHAMDIKYMQKLGVDIDKNSFVFAQPDCAEDALDLLQDMIITGKIHMVVIDSVSALTPKAELEGQSGDAVIGLQARLMSQTMRKINGVAEKTGTTIIFINQLRSKIGVMFGSNETTSGGNALKFYASIRVDIRRVGINKDKDNLPISNDTKMKIIKNKTFPPFREFTTRIVYGKGIDKMYEILEAAIQLNIINNQKGHYSIGEDKLAYGEPKMMALLQENNEFRNDLIEIIEKKLKDV